MKFKCTVTEEVIQATAKCGIDDKIIPSESCLFAFIYNQFVSNVWVGYNGVEFFDRENKLIKLEEVHCMHYLGEEINKFDHETSIERRRANFLGKEYEIEIPDEVIEYWHGDSTIAAQKLIDNPILQPIN